MNIIEKIVWRLKFLATESKGKSLNWILYNLLPSFSPLKSKILLREIQKNPEIKKLVQIKEINKKEILFDFKIMKLFYTRNSSSLFPLNDYLGLINPYQKKSWIIKKFIRKTFINGNEGPYEMGEVKLREGDYVIDAGASIGMFSIFASKKVGEKGRIFAFEPVEENQNLLEKNIKINKAKNIQIIPCALGEKEGELEFFIIPNALEKSSGFFHPAAKKKNAKQVTIDRFVKENKLPKIDFIKADVEGMERSLLKGAEKTIKRFKPRMAICIYHRPDDPEILEKILKEFVPRYYTITTNKKLYAWIP